jgi:hypothetical protein
MILIGTELLVSCFPRQWKIKDEDRNNPLHDVQKTDVMSSILAKLNSQDRSEIHTAHEMAAFVAQYCFGTFFDPTRGLGEDLQFVEFFERSIGNVVCLQAVSPFTVALMLPYRAIKRRCFSKT